jgi:hypothetical protein
MGIPGVPAEGLKTVGQITPTNATRFRFDQDGATVGVELVGQHTTGAPVVMEPAVSSALSVRLTCSEPHGVAMI